MFSDELNPACNKYIIKYQISYLSFLMLLLLIYPRTTLESVWKYSLLMEIPSSCLNNSETLTDYVTDISFSLGMEIYFRGLVLHFPISKTQWISPWYLPVLNKMTFHSLLWKHPKSGEWNFSLSYQTMLALCSC